MRLSALWLRCQPKRALLASPGLLQCVCVMAVLAVLSITAPVRVAVAQIPATGWILMSPEQYQLRWGRPAEETVALTADVASTGEQVGTAGVRQQQQPHDWSVILWDESDLRGVSTPVRIGNNDLGYNHYAVPHNLSSRVPIHAAFQTHTPDKAIGAHLEYVALVVDPDGGIHLTVRVVVQAATRTDDGRYATTDGKNIGVITAYCEGVDECPAWVNHLSTPR